MTLITLFAAVLIALALLATLGAVVYVLGRAADAPRFDYEWMNVTWDALFAPERTDVPLHWRL